MAGLQHTMDKGILASSAGADLSGTGSSQSAAVPAGCESIRFYVKTAEVRLAFGGSGVTVSGTTGIAMPAGAIDVFRIPRGATHFAYIGNGATINYVGIE